MGSLLGASCEELDFNSGDRMKGLELQDSDDMQKIGGLHAQFPMACSQRLEVGQENIPLCEERRLEMSP